MTIKTEGSPLEFADLFRHATNGNDPLPYQERLAMSDAFPSLLDVPTGLGKTAAAILGWVWRRRFASESIRNQTPRRLVYCLPMRVLVEQTHRVAVDWLKRLDLFCEDSEKPYSKWSRPNKDYGVHPIPVHLLLGGQDRTDWALWPERDAILIGTQDMILSRALNRGYGAGRARWPIEFGLLNSDCLWVIDEIQLMGSGLTTTGQLDGFSKKLWKPAKPTQFLWMSATLADSFLRTRDRIDWNISTATTHKLEADDFLHPTIERRLQKASKTLRILKERPKAVGILESHLRGRISLLMLNTVPGAKSVYAQVCDELNKPVGKNKAKGLQPKVCLIHSRFRQMDRVRQMESLILFLQKMDASGAVPDSDGLVIISTQVLEAGFDLSSARLWSEISPWPSVIQRLGRLNREGSQPDATAAFWMPKADDGNKGEDRPNAKRIGPYEKQALDASKRLVEAVIKRQSEGQVYRDALDAVLLTEESRSTLFVEPDVVIRPDDFFDLFSTEPDLAGGFTNVSQYVRDQDRDVDVHVFWRDFDPAHGNQLNESAPRREELCSVPFYEFRQFVGKSRVAWEWDFENGRWESRRENDIQPGMTLMVPKSAGGYQKDIGWTGDGKDRDIEVLSGSDEEDSLNGDILSGAYDWVSLADHLADVEAEMREIGRSVELQDPSVGKSMLTAARWHDWGKSVHKWQDAVKDHVAKAILKLDEVAQTTVIPRFDEVAAEWKKRLQSKDSDSEIWAKFPNVRAACMDSRLNLTEAERAQLFRNLKVAFRPNSRHEAASALAAWQAWQGDDDQITALAVYLIACHHGKVRTVLRSTRGTEDVFGMTDETLMQPVLNFFPNKTTLRTDPKYVGAYGEWDETNSSFRLTSPSWIQMLAELIGPKREGESPYSEAILKNEPRALGPLAIAYFEALLRAADVRASRTPGKGGKS